MSCGCILRAYKTSSLCQGCKNPRHQLAIKTEFCTVVPNIFRLSVCNLLHVILLAPRILRCLVRFCKICVPLHYTIKYLFLLLLLFFLLDGTTDLRLLNGHLPVSTVFWHLFPVYSFAFIHICSLVILLGDFPGDYYQMPDLFCFYCPFNYRIFR
jgi:hypothetical protein